MRAETVPEEAGLARMAGSETIKLALVLGIIIKGERGKSEEST